MQHRDTHITNLRGLNLTTPGECDGFCSSPHHVAVPLAIAGGQIAVFEVHTACFLQYVLILMPLIVRKVTGVRGKKQEEQMLMCWSCGH